jgi:hypothetical protein
MSEDPTLALRLLPREPAEAIEAKSYTLCRFKTGKSSLFHFIPWRPESKGKRWYSPAGGPLEKLEVDIIAARKINDIWYFLGRDGVFYKILYENKMKLVPLDDTMNAFDEVIRKRFVVIDD